MEIKVLGVKGYEDITKNLGDCILIDTGKELIVYDCGCEEHAKRVEKHMKTKGYKKLTMILSHNDADHFDGINYLIDNGYVKKLVTILLLKYKDEILKKIDDKRRTRESVGNRIKEIYDNIASLSKKVTLENIYSEQGEFEEITSDIKVVGPSLEYMIDAVAKRIDSREGDTIDKETIVNATSVQLLIDIDDDKLLLTGDSSFEAIKDNLKTATIIQLPHHGKPGIAQDIFDELHGNNNIVYIISDNTGKSNGGSNKLNTKGRIIKNTKDGDIIIPFKQAKFSVVGNYHKRMFN